MQKEKLYGTVTVKADGELSYDMTLEYYLTEEHLCEANSGLSRYGVIVRKLVTAADGTQTEDDCKQINDICYLQKDAEEFIDSLMRNQVSPANFEDVVKDYIFERTICAAN